jgi:hypothetical protein
MGQIKKHVIVIAFGLILSTGCLSQQPGWKTEHHDTMVVPPCAADVTFTERGYQDELTYTVEEPYPAPKFVHDLCEQLRLRAWEPSEGWEPSGKSVCDKPEWIKVPAPSSVKYRLTLPFTNRTTITLTEKVQVTTSNIRPPEMSIMPTLCMLTHGPSIPKLLRGK